MVAMQGFVNSAERIGAALAGGAVLLVGGSVAASSLLASFPVLGGQAVRYSAAALLLAGWSALRGQPLSRPVGSEWTWLVALAAVGMAACSVLLIEATRFADPAAVGVVIGAAPLVIALAAPIAGGRRPAGRVLVAAAVVAGGAAGAQLDGGTGRNWSLSGLLWALAALAGVAGTSLLAAPVLPRLGALAVSTYGCGIAGAQLFAIATLVALAGGPPVLTAPTETEMAALTYLAVAVTGVVSLAWYAAVERLGVARTGLFNGLVPLPSLAAVALVGTGTFTTSLILGAGTVLAGLFCGLTGAATAHEGQAEGPDELLTRGVLAELSPTRAVDAQPFTAQRADELGAGRDDALSVFAHAREDIDDDRAPSTNSEHEQSDAISRQAKCPNDARLSRRQMEVATRRRR
jgi:drug/metabolite transporter (DMT)-like permease